MTTYKVPYTFIPGTKAKANEVNENFSAVLDLISDTNKNCANLDLSNLTDAGKKVIYSNSAPSRMLGEIITSTIPLSDSSVHLLDGALITGGGVYDSFVQYIATLVNTNSTLFCSEDDWQEAVETYGVCGKFVYDAINSTVRLPKITGIIEGTTDTTALGDLIEAGLPNITGSYRETDNAYSYGYSGCYTITGDVGAGHWNASDGSHIVSFDASRCSSIYGNSDTVQPQTIKVLYYIVIATTTKLDVISDIDNIATDLNGKADNDLTNITDTGKEMIAGLGMPSEDYDELSWSNTGIYTAPANGYYLFCRVAGGSGSTYLNASIKSANGALLYVDQGNGTYNYMARSMLIPVRAGYSVTLASDFSGEIRYCRFIYAKGAISD